MRDIQLSELTYITGGESSAIPTKEEIKIEARSCGVFGGFLGAVFGLASCASAPNGRDKGLITLTVTTAGAAIGYGSFYALSYGYNSHVYQV